MNDENLNNVSSVDTDTTTDYINAIKDLKANSVDKSEYDKLKEENRQLLNSLVNGTSTTQPQEAPARTNDELRSIIFGKECSNLDFVKASLELRENILKETGEDIFVGKGAKYNPTTEDYASAQRVADAFDECIQYADGNNEIFTQELMRRTNDVKLPYRR